MGKLTPLGVAGAVLALASLAAAATTSDVYTYKASLSAGVEVPKSKAPAGAKGAFAATVTVSDSGSTIKWTLTFRGMSGKVVGAHIHKGKRGVAGAVLVPLCGPCTSGKKGRSTITKSVATLLQRGGAYVNVHTTKNAAGEIRGQIAFVKKTTGTDEPPPSDDGGGGGYPQPPGY